MITLTAVNYIPYTPGDTVMKIETVWSNGARIILRDTDTILVGQPLPLVEAYLRRQYSFMLLIALKDYT